MRYTFIILIAFIFVGCGPFNTIDSFESDGIYDNNNMKVSQNNNGIYYKNYFDQKYQEYGFDNQINDSVLTDISNYSSNTNLTYNNSNGSWGDNPTSINFIFRDRYIYSPYSNYYPFGYYDYYNSWYSPYYNRSWLGWGYGYNSWRFRHWGFYNDFYGYNYRNWNYWNYPYYNYPLYGDPYYQRNDNSNIAYMNGRRNSNNTSKSGYVEESSNGRSIASYNVGRNETKLDNSSSSDRSEQRSDLLKSRKLNRIYYNLKNGDRFNGQTLNNGKPRDYLNKGDMSGGGNNSSRGSNTNQTRSNFQPVKYGNNTRSYDKSRVNSNNRSSRGYSRPEISGNNASSRSYNISRSSSNSSRTSSISRSSSSSRPSSSVSRGSSSSSSSSASISRGKR